MMIGSARSGFVKNARRVPVLIAAYGFSEGSGTTTADTSGNGRDLTLNTVAWQPSGHTGSALTNSSASVGASNTSFLAPSAGITLMAWIRPLDLTSSTTRYAFGFIDNSGNTDAAIYLQRNDFNTPDVLQADIRISTNLSAVTGPALTVNVWTHIAVTYDGTTIQLYKDALLVGSYGPVSGPISPGDGFFVAGKNAAVPMPTFLDIDDVRVYDGALSLSEIGALMGTPVS